ncbi:hypothetical protein BAXH7_00220 [Bacillus amyloliquefaciens XH7]|nr:hypothetical protein LL3_00213 [Bacillus amyloliquefaciens LL3]AEK87368.1 hypothetical protein BAXH7_00220 [Bacillus amyloliquefaciens XH7]KYC96942.1 hypothetical protein B425_0214 [Bacillus amyloliquefaciens]
MRSQVWKTVFFSLNNFSVSCSSRQFIMFTRPSLLHAYHHFFPASFDSFKDVPI